MNESVNFNKMKVKDLRKFVSSNNIFRGGIANMKKSEIIDKIYTSDWLKVNGNVEEGDEQQQEQHQEEQETTEHPTQDEQQQEPTDEETQEPELIVDKQQLQDRLLFLQQQLELKRQEEDKLNDQILIAQESERVQQLINKALEKQRTELVSKLFG